MYIIVMKLAAHSSAIYKQTEVEALLAGCCVQLQPNIQLRLRQNFVLAGNEY